MIAESTLNIDGAGGAGRARTVSTVQCKTETLNFSHYSQLFHLLETISGAIGLFFTHYVQYTPEESLSLFEKKL